MTWYGQQQTPVRFPLIQITNTSIPAATVGQLYFQHLTVINSHGVLSFTVSGSTGSWLSCNSSGNLTGTPSVADTENIIVTVTDATGATAPANFTLTVNSPLATTLANDPFPRLRLQVIAPSNTYATTAFQTKAGLFNIVDFGPYMGIEQNQGATFATIFNNIKTAGLNNGITTRCLHYTMSSEQAETTGGTGNAATYTVWTNTVNSANWWLRSSYPGGGIVGSSDGQANTGTLQTTSQNTVVFNGQTFAQAYWNHYDKVLRQGLATSLGYASSVSIAANPFIDGYQMDNVFCINRVAGAWQNNATSFATQNATVAAWLQQGAAAQIAALKAIWPQALILCNADWFIHVPGTQFSFSVALDPSIAGTMDMVYCQSCIGVGGIEGQGTTTTANLMSNLITAEQLMTPTGTLIFEQSGRSNGVAFTSTTQSSWTAADWQAARFGMACACMRNWHYELDQSENYTPSVIFQLDEFGPQNGVRPWLGNPVDAPQSAARTQGVWWRKFAGGAVFMNPAGNGTQTLNLSTLGLNNMKAIANIGFGDNTINTGLAVSSITLNARDGRFLTF